MTLCQVSIQGCVDGPFRMVTLLTTQMTTRRKSPGGGKAKRAAGAGLRRKKNYAAPKSLVAKKRAAPRPPTATEEVWEQIKGWALNKETAEDFRASVREALQIHGPLTRKNLGQALRSVAGRFGLRQLFGWLGLRPNRRVARARLLTGRRSRAYRPRGKPRS